MAYQDSLNEDPTFVEAMNHLVTAVVGGSKPNMDESPAQPPPHIECVGCRFANQISAMNAFVSIQANHLPSETLFRLASDLWEKRVRPTLGDDAPHWTHDAIRRHYERCCLDTGVTLLSMLRDLRGIAEMLHTTVQRSEATGSDASGTLALYMKVGKLQQALHTQLHRLPPRQQPSATLPLHRPPPSQQPSATTPLQCVVRGRSLPDDARSNIRFTGHSSPSSLGDGGDDHGSCDSADEKSVADTVSGGFDAATAETWLRGALAEWTEPCLPPSKSTIQPLLSELFQPSGRSNARERHQLVQLREFQTSKPPGGRRCFCPSSRPGDACAVQLDSASLCKLIEEAPVGVRAVYRDAPTLRVAVQNILRVRQGPIHKRVGYPPFTVFGFRGKLKVGAP